MLEGVRALRDEGGYAPVVEPGDQAEVLTEPLLVLEGDTADGVARRADFWLAGVHGAAASFSSNAGHRVLLSRLKAELRDVQVE